MGKDREVEKKERVRKGFLEILKVHQKQAENLTSNTLLSQGIYRDLILMSSCKRNKKRFLFQKSK